MCSADGFSIESFTSLGQLVLYFTEKILPPCPLRFRNDRTIEMTGYWLLIALVAQPVKVAGRKILDLFVIVRTEPDSHTRPAR